MRRVLASGAIALLLAFMLYPAAALAPGQYILLQSRTPSLPVDVLIANGTPAVAAHSVVRSLSKNYNKHLFQLQRASDSSTLDVNPLSSGYADISGVASFCFSTTCGYSKIYDQVSTNDLSQATQANQPLFTTITLPGGQIVPVVITEGGSGTNGSGTFLRNRASTVNIPTGANPITEYMVINPFSFSFFGGTYGNVEATVADSGNGHMFELAFSAATAANSIAGSGSGPWPGIDVENGIWSYGSVPTQSYLTILAKYNSSIYTLKSGNSSGGALATLHSGAPNFSYVFHMEGGLSLGEGGDGTTAPVQWFEGVIVGSATSDATDSAIQTSINFVYGPNVALPETADIVPNNLQQASLGLTAMNLTTANLTPWFGATIRVDAAPDPYGNYLAANIVGTTGSQFSGLSQTINVSANTQYTLVDFVKATSSATVFPGGSVVTNGTGGKEFAYVINTNTGAVVAGTWGTGTADLLTATPVFGGWYKVKMVFTTTAGATTAQRFMSPPTANSSGVRSNQAAGLFATRYCPGFQLGNM